MLERGDREEMRAYLEAREAEGGREWVEDIKHRREGDV